MNSRRGYERAKLWIPHCDLTHVCTKIVKKKSLPVWFLFQESHFLDSDDTFSMHLTCILTSNLTKWWRSCSNIGRNSSLCVPNSEWQVSEILLSIYTSSSSYDMNTKKLYKNDWRQICTAKHMNLCKYVYCQNHHVIISLFTFLNAQLK